MARVTYVKRAQQRYETVPVIDPATGEPKRTPKMRNGEQMVTKKGRPVFLTVTVADKTKPLPLLTCDHCGEPIELGTPYKHVSPKSGPYGGRQRNRHESCPTWKVWELSNSWSARVAQVTDGFSLDGVESPEDVTAALESLADEVEGLAEESREVAQNIESGFGHSTFVSEEAEQRADELEEWATSIRDVEVPDYPEPEEEDCDTCGGTGEVEAQDEEGTLPEPTMVQCDDCDGTGSVTPEDPTQEQIDAWHAEVEDVCGVVDESPI